MIKSAIQINADNHTKNCKNGLKALKVKGSHHHP